MQFFFKSAVWEHLTRAYIKATTKSTFIASVEISQSVVAAEKITHCPVSRLTKLTNLRWCVCAVLFNRMIHLGSTFFLLRLWKEFLTFFATESQW